MAKNQTPLLLLSQLRRAAVVGPGGDHLARIEDVIARLADEGYPRITGFEIVIGGRHLFVSAAQVAVLAPGWLELREQKLDFGQFERRAGEVLLRRDVLGRRLIDVTAGRLVRAADLALAHVRDGWRLVGVAPRRRTGPRLWLRLTGSREVAAPAPLLDWSNVQPFLSDVPTSGLLMPLARLRRLHPAQIADLVERSSHREGEEIIDAVEADPELTADVFEELDAEHQEKFLEDRSNEEAAALLARMTPDAAADLLNELNQNRRLPILHLVPEVQRQRLHSLLQYHPASAGGLMSLDYLAVPRGSTVAQVLARIRDDRKIPVPLQGIVFVVEDDGRFIAAGTVVEVLRGEAASQIESLPALTTRRVDVHTDVVDIALDMTDFNLTALAVTDESGRLVGAISVDNLLEAMVPQEWRRREQGGSDD